METADIVIIGAGVIGLSIAYNLVQKKPGLKFIILEKEKFPGTGSTAKCTGGIRHQFTSRVNIELTKISLPYFKRFEEEMGYPISFEQRGYLFVTTSEHKFQEYRNTATLLENVGIPVDLLKSEEIARKFPYIESSDLVGGIICPLDGSADPYGVTQGYLKQATDRGVKLYTDEEVTSIKTSNNKIITITTSKRNISSRTVINAAGPYAKNIAQLVGQALPVEPFRRQVYVCSPLQLIGKNTPLVVDGDTGFYLHREKGGTLLLGGTDKDTAPGLNEDGDWTLLEEFSIAATKRIPALEDARMIRAYVGIRSLTPDYHAILGEDPEIKGFYYANGFSGHGFMHSPAVGLIMADLITKQECKFLDITPLKPERFQKEITLEKNIF